jgi:predicted nucleic-acid-binding protein
LIAQGISREDAKLYIAQAVCVEVFNVMKHNQPTDHARYVRNLQRLPEEPQE